MKKYDSTISLLFAGMLVSALLAGCSGGGSSSSDTAGQNQTPASIVVTPSLGKFSAGTKVNLNKIDNSLIATGTVGTDGTSTITLPANYAGPIVVEVLGGSSVTYYDEKSGLDVVFAVGKKLRAVMPSVKTTVGVTPLTNAAVAKLEAASGALASATLDSINTENTRIGAVFGLSDILLAPTPVDASTATSTGTKLNIANLGDKYALVLAALAKTAATGFDAAAVADALAADMKDGTLDGLDNSGSAPVAVSGYATTVATDLVSNYTTAASTYADVTSVNIIASTPIAITSVPVINLVTNSSDVSLAKAMFADLRTTATSLSNVSKTGFLDTQAARMNTDLSANVAPNMGRLANRFAAFDNAVRTFEDRNISTMGFVSLQNGFDGSPALARVTGDFNAAMYGYGSVDYCWTDPTAATVTTVSCAHAGPSSSVFSSSSTGMLKMVVFTLTGTGTNSYSYTATRMNWPVAIGSTGWLPVNILNTTGITNIPVGSGNYTKTVSGTDITALTVNGTLPPSATTTTGTAATGVDTVAISATRTLLTGSNYRFAMSGSVATINAVDTSKVVTLSFDNGSYIDMDESTAATIGGPKMIAAKMIGTAQTLATKFTGTLDMGSFMSDSKGMNYLPTSMVFNGSISDTSSGSAGQILTGKLEGALTNYHAVDSTLAESVGNYATGGFTFTGTVQAPNQPLMTLVVAGNRIDFTKSSVTLNYSYGTVSITGNATVDTASSANTLTLSNQDGVQVVISAVKSTPTAAAVTTGLVNRSSAKVADITNNGVINYVDGFSETLN